MTTLSSKEKIPYLLLPLFQRKMANYFPHLFHENPAVEVLPITGFTGNFFKVTAVDGQKFFLKARSFNDAELESGDIFFDRSTIVKESIVSAAVAKAGIPVGAVFLPAIVPVEDLPETLDGFSTRSVKGRERPFVLGIQNWVDGLPGYVEFDNSELQVQIFQNLGKAVSQLNAISTTGFGPQFHRESNSFALSWKERLADMTIEMKISGLRDQIGILDSADISRIQELLDPLSSFDPKPVLIHTDLNPGNYKYLPDGSIAALLDWEDAEGGAWQNEVAIQMGRIESGTFRMKVADRKDRLRAFLKGYGLSEATFQQNSLIINAFRTADALMRLYLYYVKFPVSPEPYREGLYKVLADDSYESPMKPDQSDYVYARLGRELVLRELIAGKPIQ